MKHILKFLGLKIVEVGGACAAWYGLSWLGHCVNVIISGSNPGRDDIVYTWILVPIFGVVSLVVPLTVAVIIVVMINGLIKWIKWNWKITEDKENDYEGF